jgi:hypothetical protein
MISSARSTGSPTISGGKGGPTSSSSLESELFSLPLLLVSLDDTEQRPTSQGRERSMISTAQSRRPTDRRSPHEPRNSTGSVVSREQTTLSVANGKSCAFRPDHRTRALGDGAALAVWRGSALRLAQPPPNLT